MEEVRPTVAVVKILQVFLADVGQDQYGYGLMQATDFSSAKVYQILARLSKAGWLDRFDNPGATPESDGPPRITYRLRPEAVRAARHLVADTQEELSPRARRVRARRTALGLT